MKQDNTKLANELSSNNNEVKVSRGCERQPLIRHLSSSRTPIVNKDIKIDKEESANE